MKRAFDIICASLGLLVLSPLLLATSLLVWRKLGAPVLFRQERPGRGGEPFEILKFRTMLERLGPDGEPLADADRLTPFGRKLRATSIDELPELINVIRGEMSLVGPRPLLMEYLPLYTERQARRHDVRPGLTGWAQINGRNAIGWDEKFDLDVWYVENRTFLLDLKIIAMTVKQIYNRDGISEAGSATMTKFRGSE